MVGTKQHTTSVKKLHIFMAIVLLLSMVTSLIVVKNAHAAAMTKTLVRFDRLQTGVVTTGTVCFQGSTASNSSSVVVTFPTGFTIDASSGASHYVTDNTNTGWPSGATSITGLSANATNVSGQAVTWTYTAATLNTAWKCFNWTSTGNPVTTGSAGAYAGSSQTVVLSNSDSGTYATTIVAGDTITVNATVPPSFAFTLTGTTDTLPTLSATAQKTSSSPSTVAVSTNAANGWQVWAHSILTNGGLHSNNASATIASNCSSGTGANSTLSVGVEGYNTGLEISGSGSIASVFLRSSTNYKGGGLCSANQTVASDTAVSSGTTLTIYNSASINATTKPATDYTDGITLTGAGLF
jgi:hypothetical protein